MRISLAKKYNLKNFEFSQTILCFLISLKSQIIFSENIMKTLNESYESRLMMHLLDSPVQDGGQWDMFVNLIEKYGVVPKSVMPESYQSSQSAMMNRFLTRKLREFASTLRKMNDKGLKVEDLRKEKEKNDVCYIYNVCVCLEILLIHSIGRFEIRKKKFLRYKKLTPIDFYRKHVGVKLKDKVCLINAPASNKNELYKVSFLGNVVGGQIIKYANVDIDENEKSSYQIN